MKKKYDNARISINALFVVLFLFLIAAQKGNATEPLYIIPFTSTTSYSILQYPDLGNDPCSGESYPTYAGHEGMDYGMSENTIIYAAADGTVYHDYQPDTGTLSYGNYLKIDHGGGNWTIYAHLNSFIAADGKSVKQGDPIAYSGSTGTDVPHLHFEVLSGVSGAPENGTPHNPYFCDDEWFTDSPPLYADEIQTCTTTEYRSVMVEAKASTYYNLYAWYQTQATSSLTSYGSVRDLSTESGFNHKASNFKSWYRARIAGSDNYRDIITSVEDGTKRKVYVFKATSDGGFDAPALWYTNDESKVDQLFVGDIDNDGDADLVFGNKDNSTKKFSWTRCTNNGSSFTSCTAWNNTSEDDKTFGKEGDVFLVGDFNGNGKIELLRGREQTSGDCTGQLKWNRLGIEGVGSTIDECWGYPEEIGSGDTYKAQYLAGDIDNDGADEIINIRINTSSGVVNAFKGNYNKSSDSLTTSDWTTDGVNIEGSNGWYYTADINNDGYTDLVRWGDEGEVKWMKSDKGILKNTKYTLATGVTRSEDNILIFGYFGDYPDTECTRTSSSGAAGGDDNGSFETSGVVEDDDEDGLTNDEEASFGTDPNIKDTDNDGISDYEEYQTMLATLEAAENTNGGGGCSFWVR